VSKSTLTVLEPTDDSFGSWLRTPGFRRPLATVLHHTYSPDAHQYHGRDSIIAIRSYHMHTRGFSDIAANAYACPDGTVVTGRPLDTRNWAHAFISRTNPEAELLATAGHDRMWLNHYAFGLEMVGNFDVEDPDKSRAFEVAVDVLALVHRLCNIPTDRLFFHRDAAEKSCPGTKLNRAVVRDMLAQRLQAHDASPAVVLDASVIDCSPVLVDDEWTVDAAKFLGALGASPELPPGVVHANGRAYVGELARYLPEWAFPWKRQPQGLRLYPKRVA